MLRITFDANVWKPAASPHRFPKAPNLAALQAIQAAAAAGKFLPTVPESVFTLEAVKEALRVRFSRETANGIKADGSGPADGTMKIGRPNAAPVPRTHPEGNPHLARFWDDALLSRFKLLRCPRLVLSGDAELRNEWFIPASYDIVKRFNAFSRGIESTGCGLSRLQAIEAQEPRAKPPWHEAIAAATVPLATAITKAVAEWVDGDTVSAHYAYANDYICTTNAGVGGPHSIMSTQNRDTVLRRINIRFLGPDELAAMLAKF